MTKQTKQRIITAQLAYLRAKHPTWTDTEIRNFNYYEKTDTTANGLTQCVKDYLTYMGHQAERISSTGRYVENEQTFTNQLGHKKTYKNGKWIKSTSTRGTADISSTIAVTIAGHHVGLSVKWEVKIGKDRQSADQKAYEQQINTAAGYYFIITSMDDFFTKFDWLISQYN